MALHQKSRRQPLGLPEGVLLLFIACSAAALFLWQRSENIKYSNTQGHVLACDISWTHYNAADMRQKVALTYQYEVDGATHTASWAGFWPEDHSPNALAPGQLNTLRNTDRVLTIFYDSANPSRSFLHPSEGRFTRFAGGIAIGMCVWTLVYCTVVYPAWKNRAR